MTISKKDAPFENFEDQADIGLKLLALEGGENPATREAYRAAVRDYSNYVVPFVFDEHGAGRAFKIAGLYGVDSVPVFLSEADYLSFLKNYLTEHGYLDEIAGRHETLAIRTFSGKELSAMLPQSSLGSVFILSSGNTEFLFNFNLAEVFKDCFHQIWTDPDLQFDPVPENAPEIGENQVFAAIRNAARHKIEKSKGFRRLFENREWTVLISLPTKNKLLKGEFSRDDFALDRYDDGRILIFSAAAAVDQYQTVTGQSAERLYNIKVDGRRIFGSDLACYEGLIIDPYSPDQTLVGKEYFKPLNELFAAFEIEGKLLEIANARKNSINYTELTDYFIGVKEFKNFILPVDKTLTDRGRTPFGSVFERARDNSGGEPFPVFTAEDCFEAFRLRGLEESGPAGANLVEPHFIDGPTLFQKMSQLKTRGIIFNPEGPVQPIAFEPGFALKVYCA